MKKVLILPILIAAIGFAACSSAKTDLSKTEKNNAVTQITTQSDTLTLGEQTVSVSDQGTDLKRETRSGYFNTEIDVSYDAYGNKVENRYFKNDQRLSSLVILTRVNGTKEIRVFGIDGSFRNLSSDTTIDVLTAPPDEIADTVGIIKPFKPIVPAPQIATKIEPVQTEDSIISTQQIQPATEEMPVIETNKTESGAETQQIPVQQAKQPTGDSESKNDLNQF